MGRTIVTKTKAVKEPYRMRESGHSLYSYEELCYYIYSRMSLWVMEKNRSGMTDWLRGCDVLVDDVDHLSPYEAAAKILSAGSYFRPEERMQILDRMKRYKDFPIAYVEKEKGDLYLHYGKTKKAYFAYDKAASHVSGEESDEWRASLYHNMGAVRCRFFYWEDAKKWFMKAKEVIDRKETQIALDLVEDVIKMGWESMEGEISPEELEKKKQEFINEL